MNQKQDNLITVLDAGSTKSCVLVAEVQDGVLRYRGHGVELSKGMRKGLIAELGPAAEVDRWDACAGSELAGRHQHGQPDAGDYAGGGSCCG